MLYDLQLLAYQSDLTRVITFMYGREQTGRPYPQIGVPEAAPSAHASPGQPGEDGKMRAKFSGITSRCLPSISKSCAIPRMAMARCWIMSSFFLVRASATAIGTRTARCQRFWWAEALGR